MTTTFGSDNSWRIELSESSTTVCSSDPISYSAVTGFAATNYKEFKKLCKLCTNRNYKIHCADSYGDGWEAYGSADGAYVRINGRQYCQYFGNGFSFSPESLGQLPDQCEPAMIVQSDSSCRCGSGAACDLKSTTPACLRTADGAEPVFPDRESPLSCQVYNICSDFAILG